MQRFRAKPRYFMGIHLHDTSTLTCTLKLDKHTPILVDHQTHTDMSFDLLCAHIKKRPHAPCQLIIGLELNHIIIKNIALPQALSDKQIRRYLSANSTHIFGLPANDLIIDYDFTAKHATTLIAAACKRDFIMDLQRTVSRYKLSLTAIQPIADSLKKNLDDDINLLSTTPITDLYRPVTCLTLNRVYSCR